MEKPKRRFGIWFLAVLFIVIGLSGLSRFWLVAQNGAFYRSLDIQVSIGYLLVGGLLWAGLGFGAGVVLFLRRRFVPWVVWGCAAALTLTYWLDRLVMTVNLERVDNWAFMLFINVLGLLLLWWTFSRKKNQAYFEWSKQS